MEDVLVNARERWPAIAFEIREVAVQGVQAVPAVTAALAELDAMPEVDVIILARGGGSVEDLLPFSNEALVRAVAACLTPVVSAIGHEQDTPLVDFVADLRASTPTDAAKRVVPSWPSSASSSTACAAAAPSCFVNLIDREQQGLTHRRAAVARRSCSTRIDAAVSDVGHLTARVRATVARGHPRARLRDRHHPDGRIVRPAGRVATGEHPRHPAWPRAGSRPPPSRRQMPADED